MTESTGLPEIQLSSYNYTVGHWMPREDYDSFDLNAPYQRGSVWTDDQRRALIKSLLMGLPVGAIIISKLPIGRPGWKGTDPNYRVVDGKQRLETVRSWCAGGFTCPTSWFRPEYLLTETTRMKWVNWFCLSEQCHRRFDMSIPLPALEFNGELEFLGRNPDGKGWITRTRSDAEILAAEAELFALINGGGTPQTEDDMARAAAIAGVR